jgi:hypothetical protein
MHQYVSTLWVIAWPAGLDTRLGDLVDQNFTAAALNVHHGEAVEKTWAT